MNRVKAFLDGHHVPYQTIPHILTFTAQGTAAAAHIPGKEIAKTVILRCDGTPVMVVLPAPFRVDLRRIRQVLGVQRAEVMPEHEIRDLFPDCDLGAMPPFGKLYHMELVSDASLAKDDSIAFNAGSHRELIRMAFRDFDQWAKPRFAPVRA